MAQRYSDETVAKLLRLYNKGLRLNEILRQCNIKNIKTVRRYARLHNLPPRRKRLTETEHREIIALYLSGEKVAAIASLYGISERTPVAIARKAGLRRGRWSRRGASVT